MQDITRPRVLCVDDDEDSREMLTMLLRHSALYTYKIRKRHRHRRRY